MHNNIQLFPFFFKKTVGRGRACDLEQYEGHFTFYAAAGRIHLSHYKSISLTIIF
jgi:hypothetical protein